MGPVQNVAQCEVHCSNWHWLQCNAYEVRTNDKISHLYLLFNGQSELVNDRLGTFVYIRTHHSNNLKQAICYIIKLPYL